MRGPKARTTIRRRTVVAAVAAAGAAALSGSALDSTRTYVLPGDQVFPESVIADPVIGFFYVSGARDGTLYRGHPDNAELEVYLPGGADGRTMAQGLRLDRRGWLHVMGGTTGQLWVYDTADRSLVRRFDTGLRTGTFVNDVTFDAEGNAYATDSYAPVLWRIRARDLRPSTQPGTPERFVDLTDSVVRYQDGFNLNGITLARDGRSLLTIQSNTGKLFRIDLDRRDAAEVPVTGGVLTSGDSLTPVGNRLLVTRNAVDQVATLELGASGARVSRTYTDATLHHPTAATVHRGDVLVPNSQFDRWTGQPDLPFTVSSVPLHRLLP